LYQCKFQAATFVNNTLYSFYLGPVFVVIVIHFSQYTVILIFSVTVFWVLHLRALYPKPVAFAWLKCPLFLSTAAVFFLCLLVDPKWKQRQCPQKLALLEDDFLLVLMLKRRHAVA
jgi:hypothetical protein